MRRESKPEIFEKKIVLEMEERQEIVRQATSTDSVIPNDHEHERATGFGNGIALCKHCGYTFWWENEKAIT